MPSSMFTITDTYYLAAVDSEFLSTGFFIEFS